jgi:outer membrane protein assembly factor BamA
MHRVIARCGERLMLSLVLLCIPGGGAAAGADGSAIRSLRWTGVTALSTSLLENLLVSRPGARLDRSALLRDLDTLTAAYRREGYWSARVRGDVRYSDDSASVNLEFSVDEGRPAVVARLVWAGLDRFTVAQAEARFVTAVGRTFRSREFEEDVARLLELYEQSGYALARCALADAAVAPGEEADSLTLRISVEEGELVTLDEIRIEGAKETDPEFILRETRLREGEIYSPARLRGVRDRLNRLGIFGSVADPELYERGGKHGVLIRLQEGNPNTFDGIVGYLPAPGGGTGEFTGLLSLSMRNLFGTGRKLALRWERENRNAQEIGVRFAEPWVAGLPVQLGGGFQQRQQDSAYVRRAGDLRIDFFFVDRVTTTLIGVSETVLPSAVAGNAAVFRSSALTIGGEILYDSRDDAVNPTEGLRLRTSFHYGRRSIPPDGGTVPLRRLDWDCEGYVGVLPGQILALSAHGRQVAGSALQEPDLYRFGGATTLRGYRENEFIGALVGWMSAEYRILTGRRGNLFAFADGGYYQRPEIGGGALTGVSRFLIGVGIGVRIDTPVGMMEVSLAAGEGDTIGSMKAHVRLISEF